MAGALVLLAAFPVTWFVIASGEDSNCEEKLAAAEAKVRTDRSWTEQELPGIGRYVAVHWQLRAAGNPCSWAPGPTDYDYQGVLRLRSADAAALARAYDWGESDAPAPVWPGLRPHVPPNTHWRSSPGYAAQHQWIELYLDADRAVALFIRHDH